MHEFEEKTKHICDVKDTIISNLKQELACGIDNSNVQQIGLVVDMVKDLVHAEKNCAETLYYLSVAKAMDDYGDEESSDRYGYDRYRYASGRFAPKGKGHYSGYHPISKMPPYIHDMSQMYEDGMIDRMGYDDSGRGNRSQSGSRYGYNYDKYDEARQHFNETKDPRYKDEMSQEAMHHVRGFKESVKDMWTSSDPDLRQKLKSEMQAMISELK